MSEQSKTPRAFEYLLNAMENASHHTNPAEHSYGEKRNAVFQHVSQLETDLADARAALREIRNGCDNVKMCCGNPTEGGGYAGFDHPPDPPQCCGEPDMLHDVCDAILAKQG